jgi:hypothetical protein
MLVHYHENIVDEYKGLELMNPESCAGSPIIRFDQITKLPNRLFEDVVIGKFRVCVQRAYYDIISPLNGSVLESGVKILNGMHRAVVQYMLVGQKGYLTVMPDHQDPQEPKVTNSEVPQRLDTIIEREGLKQIAREEIAKMDELEESDNTKYRLSLLNPLTILKLMRLSNYEAELSYRDIYRGRGKILTEEHLTRLQ